MNRCGELLKCIKSILKSSYSSYEIIIVDNNSSDNTVHEINLLNKKLDKKIKLIRSDVNLGAGGGRNLGAKFAKSKYLLFIDSDNIVDRRMLEFLVYFYDKTDDCGMVGPLMLHGSSGRHIWLYYADINMYTSRAFYRGSGEIDENQYPTISVVGHLPNCFLLSREDFNAVGGFNEKYKVVYEEAEIAERIKKMCKKKVYLYTKAKTRHVVEFGQSKDSLLGLRSSERAYLTARNRIYFMRRNGNFLQKISFFLLFNTAILFYYDLILLKNGEYSKAYHYTKGFFDGFIYH